MAHDVASFAGSSEPESHEKRRPLAERLEILRPTLKRAAEETAQLEIDPVVALQLFGRALKGKG